MARLPQLAIEHAVPGGGGVGLLSRGWASTRGRAVAGRCVPERMTVSLDGRVLAFQPARLHHDRDGVQAHAGVAGVAGRPNLVEGRKSDRAAARAGRHRAGLIVAELSLAVVLLVGCGLLIETWLSVAMPAFIAS